MPRLLSKRIVFDVKKVLMLYSENIQYAIIQKGALQFTLFHLCPPHHHHYPLPPPHRDHHHHHHDHLLGEPSGGSWGSSTGGFGSEGNYTILIIGFPRWLILSAVIIIDGFGDSPTKNDNYCWNYLNGPVVDLFPGATALAQHCSTHLSWSGPRCFFLEIFLLCLQRHVLGIKDQTHKPRNTFVWHSCRL